MKQIDSFFRATPVNQSGLLVRESEVNATIPEANVPEVLNQETGTNNLQANVPQRFNQADIEADPGLRKQIEEYATPEIRDEVRRAYLTKGPCQPKDHDFKRNEDDRAFRVAWYKEFDWLEFSVAKDVAYCFYCFLFKKPTISSKFGGEVFTKTGYTNWRKAVENCSLHVGSTKSAHNNSRRHCEDFKNQKQSVVYAITTQTEKAHIEYQSRSMAVVGVVRFLLRQGLAFRGHDESKNSRNKGNFCEMLDWYAQRCKEAADVLHDNAPINRQMTCHDIQKQLVQACAEKTTEFMMNELGDGQFSFLVDESRDASIKEQMAVVVRFVNKQGETLERLLCVEHVVDTTSASLKRSLDKVFATHNLSMSRLRGQGYDGASNMRGQLNGLKKLVLDDNPHAFYVHCFAHQLQLVVVAVVKGVLAVSDFFGYTNIIVTTVSASWRRKDALLQKHHDKIVLQLENGEIMKGRGKHQETTIARPGDTRWGSHQRTLVRIYQMWDSVIQVVHAICFDGENEDDKGKASGLMKQMEAFEFVLILHLMIKVLGLTNDLSQALQQKDQNIVSAMNMIVSVKRLLQHLRDEGWEPLLETVTVFCVQRDIPVPNMNDNISARGYPRSSRKSVTCLYHYKVEIFNEVIDRNIVEMNNRFSETTTWLLICISCLDPRDSFSNFNHEKLIELASIYSADFDPEEHQFLSGQLDIYIDVMKRSPIFCACYSLSTLSVKLVQTKEYLHFSLVYQLIKLALILPVATASVERAFSAMNIIKTDLRNKIGDEWLNDMMVCYVERDIFAGIEDQKIIEYFHGLKNRKGHLPNPPRITTT